MSAQVPIHPIIADRWSPYGFDPRPIPHEDLRGLFDAARVAPSSYNDQPWRFIVAGRDDEAGFARLVSCLAETNQPWATNAGALVITVTKTISDQTAKPNRFAWHDVGLAIGNLLAQATSIGLYVHQMGGFSATKARAEFGIPDGYEPVSAIAIGYASDSDEKRRGRKSLEGIVFGPGWGSSTDITR
jgi:nitroreductase